MKKVFIMLLPLSLILKYLASFNPLVIEEFYSNRLYRGIIKYLTSVTRYFPFSIAEGIVVLLLILTISYIIFTLFMVIRYKKNINFFLKNFIINLSAAIGIIYFGFIILWGLNYYRVPFSNIADLESQKASYIDLEKLCRELIKNTNEARKYVSEDSRGVMKLKYGKEYVLKNAQKGFDNISIKYPELSGNYGRAKAVILSTPMSFAGISGVYFPFTGEANINILTPDSLLPSTVCHEMSHQRGFAREDESNYIAYLTCINHTDSDFKYSGYLLALINTLRAVKSNNPVAYKSLILAIDPAVKRDINYLNTFWSQYEGFITKISERINDLYLKSNKQSYGIESYGRMVDLLILEYKSNKVREQLR